MLQWFELISSEIILNIYGDVRLWMSIQWYKPSAFESDFINQRAGPKFKQRISNILGKLQPKITRVRESESIELITSKKLCFHMNVCNQKMFTQRERQSEMWIIVIQLLCYVLLVLSKMFVSSQVCFWVFPFVCLFRPCWSSICMVTELKSSLKRKKKIE